jgi:hypothetical protein
MFMLTVYRFRLLNIACPLALTLFVCGCFHPGMYQPGMYAPQMYAPPQNVNPGYAAPGYGAPGSLYIPESSGQPYVPNGDSTYEQDPVDEFQKAPPYYSPEDKVPFPDEPGGGAGGFDEDLGTSTQLIPADGNNLNTVTRPVAYTTGEEDFVAPEFGFDRTDYRWLQGILHYDPATAAFYVEYSLAADDTFGGMLRLRIDADIVKSKGLRDRHPVEVRGHVETAADGAVYHVEDIRRLATRVAM